MKFVLATLVELSVLGFVNLVQACLGLEELVQHSSQNYETNLLPLLQTQSSHLRDELLMLLGFLSFKSFPMKTFDVLLCDV